MSEPVKQEHIGSIFTVEADGERHVSIIAIRALGREQGCDGLERTAYFDLNTRNGLKAFKRVLVRAKWRFRQRLLREEGLT